MAKKTDAERFARNWSGRGNEDQDTQLFWIDLFQNVLGVDDALDRLKFEVPVSTAASEHKGYIDVLIPSAQAIVEQKSLGIDLSKPEKRQGRMVTPAQQANGYIEGMGLAQQPRYVIACNFSEFWVYDRNIDSLFKEPMLKLSLEDLPKNLPALQFLKGSSEAPRSVQRAVSIEAGRIMGQIHNEIAGLYHDPDSEESHHALSVLCTRLMFLMFCEDAGLIEPGLFRDYVASVDGAHLRGALIELFAWLDTDDEARKQEYPSELLARFPYMNGGLFRERIQIPQLNEQVHYEILVSGCQEFDWSGVDPTVFGSIFEGALSHDTRRAGGMHYTSPENIHKVIDPLFLDGLKEELDEILAKRNPSARTRALRAYHDKLGSLTFLDPACGSGNFLTETYVCLRRIENDVLIELQSLEAARKYEVAAGQMGMEFSLAGTGADLVKVSLANFHGIEVNDFACCVARTALWIAEKQADMNTAKVVKRCYDELPLNEYGTIVKANALQLDWNEVVPACECDYIMGNPPFIGASLCTAQQKGDIVSLFGKIKLSNSLDYVSGWYYKASEMMAANPAIRSALVSTNSICQGEQVAPLWGTLRKRFGIRIDFAWKTFIWNSQATDEAHVHCVIVGFSVGDDAGGVIFERDGMEGSAQCVSPYLIDAPWITVSGRSKPLGPGHPVMKNGSKPTDGGWYLFTDEEKDEFLSREPASARFFRPWVGSVEFINRTNRWCLYLGDVSPSEIVSMPHVLERVQAVRDVRLGVGPNSKGKMAAKKPPAPTQKAAATPMRFFCDNVQEDTYLIVPNVSSSNRKYVPIGFMEPNVIASNLVATAEHATLYDFGIMTSQFHNAWLRTVGGRLKSDYRYTPGLVYNTFPWPESKDGDVDKISALAQKVLDAREGYLGCSYADLYGSNFELLFSDLAAAHRELDAAVEAAYGVDFNGDEEKIVSHLFKLYAQKANEE